MTTKKLYFYNKKNKILKDLNQYSTLPLLSSFMSIKKKQKFIEGKLHACFKTLKRINCPLLYSNQLKRNTHLRFFVTTARLHRNFLPDYFLKTSEKSQKLRWQHGEQEIALISKRFSLFLKWRLPDFYKQWNFPMKDEVQGFIEFPTLYDVRKAVLYYPTTFFFFNKNY